ncbi:MAG: hypothetical protein M1833_004273 [Piccolia ochrophora]|nr:MAG: hypothetical protein M1833_004273 [Piccolia ochrophora]
MSNRRIKWSPEDLELLKSLRRDNSKAMWKDLAPLFNARATQQRTVEALEAKMKDLRKKWRSVEQVVTWSDATASHYLRDGQSSLGSSENLQLAQYQGAWHSGRPADLENRYHPYSAPFASGTGGQNAGPGRLSDLQDLGDLVWWDAVGNQVVWQSNQ